MGSHSAALLVTFLASLPAIVSAQESHEHRHLLGRDSEQLERDLAQTIDQLLGETTIGHSLPPETLKARRCEKLQQSVEHRHDGLRAEFHKSINQQLVQAFRAGIDSAPQQDAVDAHKERTTRDGTPLKHDEKLRELEKDVYSPMIELLKNWDVQETTGYLADVVLLELAWPQAANQLECGAVVDVNAQAAEMAQFSDSTPEAKLAYWSTSMRLLPKTDDPVEYQRQRLDLMTVAARKVALLMQKSEPGDDYYEAGMAVLAQMTGGSRSRESYRKMSNRLEDYSAIDLRLLAVSDAFFKRTSPSQTQTIELLTGVNPVSLRNRTSFVDRQLAVFSDQQRVSEVKAWATETVEQMLDSPASLEEALVNILGE